MRIRFVALLRRTSAASPGWIGPGRLLTAIAMLALVPAASELAALTALALVAAACCALVVWDVVHYREQRVEVRQARP
jgi:hypothetical protein